MHVSVNIHPLVRLDLNDAPSAEWKRICRMTSDERHHLISLYPTRRQAKEINATDNDPKLDMVVYLEGKKKDAEIMALEIQKDKERKRPKVRKLPN